MSENKNYIFNNTFKTILILILILQSILMGVLIYQYNKINSNNRVQFSPKNGDENTFGFDNAKILLAVTLKSENLSAGEISKNIENFATKAIPLINKEILKNNSQNITKIYEDNIELLLNYAGIESEKEFTELCNKLKNVDCNLDELSSASYMEGTTEYSNNILKINVKLIDKNQKYIMIKLTYNPDNNVQYKYEVLE